MEFRALIGVLPRLSAVIGWIPYTPYRWSPALQKFAVKKHPIFRISKSRRFLMELSLLGVTPNQPGVRGFDLLTWIYLSSSSVFYLLLRLCKYVNRKFSNQYKATIGADFLSKKFSNLKFEDRAFILQQDKKGSKALAWLFIEGLIAENVYDVNVMKSFLLQASPNDPENFPFVVL
ncbi:ras-related protein Rab7-like [Impatiens glandulifera]|uniref:ras-related protein Rab7-like n=1 Tax=Impatiens glandulifera TaxID=253017 RepID=UPI001FB14ECD|nr:ras-related protein Rab7-like [Impatiens glandulifera]